MQHKLTYPLSMLTMLLILGGCSNNDIADTAIGSLDLGEPAPTAFWVASRSSDYVSGQIEQYSNPTDLELDWAEVQGGSDILVESLGGRPCVLGRSNMNSLSCYRSDGTLDFQFSVDNGSGKGNPYSLVAVDDRKAYLTRYDASDIAILDLQAEDAAGFITGSIDLSHYDSDSGAEVSDALLLGTTMWVLVERLEDYTAVKQGYLVAIDTTSDTEIDTAQDPMSELFGIPLGVFNPTALQFDASSGLLYVLGRGDYYQLATNGLDRYSGGIVSIDPNSYVTELVLDDGDADSNQGFFYDLAVVGNGVALLQTYAEFGDSTLRAVNTITGTITEDVVANLDHVDLTGLALDGQGRTWVSVVSPTPGLNVIASDGLTSLGFMSTGLIPNNVAFPQ